MKRLTFRLEQDLVDAVDTVSSQFGLNRTQYLCPGSFLPMAFRYQILYERSDGWRAGRGRLRLPDQLKGVRAALGTDPTPPQLIAGLKKRAAQLEKALKDKPNA